MHCHATTGSCTARSSTTCGGSRSGDGMDIVAVLKDVLGLFETSAAEGKPALDVTGEDVAAFCDDRLRDVPPSYTDKWRATLNRDVVKKLGPAGRQG